MQTTKDNVIYEVIRKGEALSPDRDLEILQTTQEESN